VTIVKNAKKGQKSLPTVPFLNLFSQLSKSLFFALSVATNFSDTMSKILKHE
jgi:hypothetical protein